MGSMLEALYYKVPIVAIGIFGDQVKLDMFYVIVECRICRYDVFPKIIFTFSISQNLLASKASKYVKRAIQIIRDTFLALV